jgi:hypothetical protein
MHRARFVLVAGLLGLAAGPIASGAAAGPAVTVYSRDLGFVRETRTLDLGPARDTVRLADIPDRVDFSSVRLVPASGRVTRLAYRFDVTSGDGLLDKVRGSRVRVTSRGDRATEGVLVAADGGWLVVRADNGAVSALSRVEVEEVRLANPPGDMSLRPRLEAVIENAKAGRGDAELSYLTGGLSWSAEHTLVRTGEGTGIWSARVTVENTTGREYRDATLKLVAGEPSRQGGMPQPMLRSAVMTLGAEAKADLGEEAFSEYHLYTLDRPATLRDREIQSLSMLVPRPVKLAPRYFYRGGAGSVTSQILIENTDAAGLGVPLPAGRVRLYESDATGATQFTGETRIAHTPEGEKLTLDVGAAFDLAAERREVSQQRISDREREVTVEIKIRNRKKTNVTVLVEEGVAGETEVLKSTHPATKKDANTLQFSLPVAAGKETVLTYTARMRY